MLDKNYNIFNSYITIYQKNCGFKHNLQIMK